MTNRDDGSRIERRKFLQLAWGVSVFALLGQASANLWRFFQPPQESGAFGSRIVAGEVTEFLAGTVSHVQKGRFYVSRLDDGGMLALWQRCTHLGCTVPWREGEGRFNCPCHSSIYNRVGEVISGPAPRPLDRFPIAIEDGQIVVDTGSPIQRERYDPSDLTYE